MVGYIYRITNKVTGQHYIGQTVDINRRKRTHFNSLKRQDHDNPKLQASWNKYGEDNFEFESWEFQIDNLEQLNELECSYIDKYEGLTMGFNLVPGGGRPPLHQKVKDDDVATFLCVQKKVGDGYGKTCEQIFGWSKGTASAAKRKIRYLNGWNIYESMSSEEQDLRAQDFIESQHLKEQALKRQLTQGGCEKAYQLTQDDFNFAFAAQSQRFSEHPRFNANLTSVETAHLINSPTIRSYLEKASKNLQLSARAYFRLIRVARTIADLAGEAEITTDHVSEAIRYRQIAY